MIVALLIMIAATVVTGMANLAADQGTGPLSGLIAKVERPAARSRREASATGDEAGT
jgi:hypothetical protein